MISPKWHERMHRFMRWLQAHVGAIWYPPLIGLLSLLDNFIIVIPNDGILISSSMLTPRRWFWFAVAITIGSTLGAIALAALVEFQGLPWILHFYPGIQETSTWAWSMKFFNEYGLLLVFLVAVTPLMQQPAVILASLAAVPLAKLAAVIFVGRFIKYLIMAYLASHAPRLLKKMWGVKRELKDADIQIN